MIKNHECLPTGHKRRWIRANVKFSQIRNLPEVPIQRNTDLRVNKMSKIFARVDTAALHDFTVFNILDDMVLEYNKEKLNVPAGEYVGNGCTRKLSNEQLISGNRKFGYEPPNDGVLVLGVDIETPEQLEEEYFGTDSTDATETKAHKIQGAIDKLGLNVTSSNVIKGSFASALDYAYPGDTKDKPLEKIAYFKDEIEMLDECRVFNPTEESLANQGFYCSALIAAKLYSKPNSNNARIKKILTTLSNLDADALKTNDTKWSGITVLMHHMVYPERHKRFPMEYYKSTKRASWVHHQGFFLYCFELAMNDKLVHKTKGVKPTIHWYGERPDGSIYSRYTETLEALEQLYPTS